VLVIAGTEPDPGADREFMLHIVVGFGGTWSKSQRPTRTWQSNSSRVVPACYSSIQWTLPSGLLISV
jgi:hypothetical protein